MSVFLAGFLLSAFFTGALFLLCLLIFDLGCLFPIDFLFVFDLGLALLFIFEFLVFPFWFVFFIACLVSFLLVEDNQNLKRSIMLGFFIPSTSHAVSGAYLESRVFLS